jgi:nucleoside-diphosphate-sugar epimerase
MTAMGAPQETGVVLVTGATGFLGTQVVRTLKATPGVERIVVATHRREPEREWSAAGLETVKMDLSGDIALPNGIATVIHVAGETREPARFHEVNTVGAGRFAQACCASRIRRFVHVSTVGVYGAGPQAGEVNETYPRKPAIPYEVSKEAGETAVVEACAASSTRCVVLRPSNVVGIVPGTQYPLLGMMRSIAKGLFTWFGPPDDVWCNYVHVDDTAAAIVHAARSPVAAGPYNVNSPVRLESAVRWIAEELHAPVPGRRLPRWLGKAVATAGSSLRTVTGRNVPLDRKKFRELTNRTHFDPRRLVETGFAYPWGAERTFRALARFYREAGLA